MKVCAVAFKPCWQDASGRWYSDGGYPLQMEGITSLFDEATILVARRKPGVGGMPLPAAARVVAMRSPIGSEWSRKITVLLLMPYYIVTIMWHAMRADAVHIPLPGDVGLIGLLIALLLRKKVLVRYGGSWHVTSHTTLTNRFIRWVMRSAAGGRNVMLATGNGEEPPGTNIHWLFSSALRQADVSAITPDVQRGLSTPPRVGYVGRLSDEKGVHVLLDAFGKLAGMNHATLPHLYVIGDGPERAALEKQAQELSLSDHVTFTGQLGRKELSKQLLQLDMTIQPSFSEGYCKAWIDALAHGLPVLSSRVGAAAHVIGERGERGWLVPPGDADALARAWHAVLTGEHDWHGLRARCRAFAASLTLEQWIATIGEHCARHWDMVVVNGKLRPRTGTGRP